MRKIVDKIINSKGFTLSETLITILILLMVFSIVAAGIPSALRALNGITDSSDAQLLLSNTMTRLRDELGKASELSNDGDALIYKDSEGISCRIDCAESSVSSSPGIYLHRYDASNNEKNKYLLVSDKKLYMTYSIDNDYDQGGVLTISDLSVKKGTDTLLTVDEFKIRVIIDAN